MAGTPRSHAKTPGRRAGPDVFSEMLEAVRLTGSVFLHACFTAPFGVIAPKYYDPGLPQAHLRHISIMHLIVSGSCTLEAADGDRREVHAGDLLFLPFAAQHKFCKGEPEGMVLSSKIIQAGPIEGMSGLTPHATCGLNFFSR